MHISWKQIYFTSDFIKMISHHLEASKKTERKAGNLAVLSSGGCIGSNFLNRQVMFYRFWNYISSACQSQVQEKMEH